MAPLSGLGEAGRPLVSLLITTKDRPEELCHTVRQLRRLAYEPMELIVIDDASAVPVEDLVRKEWPDARVLRRTVPHGLIANRSTGMKLAEGAYVVSVDDDSHLVDAYALRRAVARFEAEPEVGALAFKIRDSVRPVVDGTEERYAERFVGCGHMLRRDAIEQVGGYQDFLEYYCEEREYGLRLWDRGWRILFFPSVVVEHRRSAIGRSSNRAEGYRFRNTLWTILLTYPFPQLIGAVAWQLAANIRRTFRTRRFQAGFWALGSAIIGLGTVLRKRRAVSPSTIRIYDAVRFRVVTSPTELASSGPVSLSERARWAWRDALGTSNT